MAVELRFAAGADLASEVIEWFGGNVGFSHVDAVLPPNDPQPGWLLGARHDRVGGQPPGVQARPPDYRVFPKTRVVRIPTTQTEAEKFYAGLRREIGKPYSAETIWDLALGLRGHDRSGWICDSLQAWHLAASRILPEALFPYIRAMTPNSLYLIAITASHMRILP